MLTINHSYLVRQKQAWLQNLHPQNLHPIVKMKVIDITEKCYQIEWENKVIVWKLKTDFDQNFEIIEELKNTQLEDLIERWNPC